MKEKMGISPDQVIDLKALMGDSSDNIPGVPGVGQKTATKLLNEYETLENVYEHVDDINGKKLKENLVQYKDDAFMSKELVTIKRDTPITITEDDLFYDGFDKEKVLHIFRELGFNSLVGRFEGSEQAPENQMEAIDYTIVKHVSNDMFTKNTALVVELLQENYHQAQVEGIGIVTEKENLFIPSEVALQSSTFKNWAENPDFNKNVFDEKRTLISLMHHSIYIKCIVFDML